MIFSILIYISSKPTQSQLEWILILLFLAAHTFNTIIIRVNRYDKYISISDNFMATHYGDMNPSPHSKHYINSTASQPVDYPFIYYLSGSQLATMVLPSLPGLLPIRIHHVTGYSLLSLVTRSSGYHGYSRLEIKLEIQWKLASCRHRLVELEDSRLWLSSIYLYLASEY